MTEEGRSLKNKRIKETSMETRLRHSLMHPFIAELKLDLKCLNSEERLKLNSYFIEGRWLKNYLLSLAPDDFKVFDTKIRDIFSIDKDGNRIERHLELPAKLLQAVKYGITNDKKALARRKKQTGTKLGKLRFVSAYTTFNLNQYGDTHWICYGKEGNKNGKYRNTVHIVGIKRPIRVFGMDQIPEGAETANAKLVKRPSGIYLLLTCYKDEKRNGNNKEKKPSIGLDFGIKTTITTSEGEKFDISVREQERLKGLQRKLARQKKGYRGWHDTRNLIRREYEKLSNKRKAKANQIYHDITEGRKLIAMQDENIKGWYKGLFGKQVQNSALGTLKKKLLDNPNVIVIDRYFPSTKMCPICGKINETITLSDRVFVCDSCGYSENRDVKAAKILLLAGKRIISCTLPEQKRTSEEWISDFGASCEAWKHSTLRPKAPMV